MKEVKLSEVGKSPIGELSFMDAVSYRFAGTKDLHDAQIFHTDLLGIQFGKGIIELYFVVEDEEYVLINDKESSYETAIK